MWWGPDRTKFGNALLGRTLKLKGNSRSWIGCLTPTIKWHISAYTQYLIYFTNCLGGWSLPNSFLNYYLKQNKCLHDFLILSFYRGVLSSLRMMKSEIMLICKVSHDKIITENISALDTNVFVHIWLTGKLTRHE